MASLIDSLGNPEKRKVVVADCVVMIDEEVASKGGLSGIAIKTIYKVVKGLKPTFIAESVEALVDDFCKCLQPLADEAGAKSVPIGKFFAGQRSRVADALLSITDQRAQRSHHAVVKGSYDKLRPSAKRNVEDAAPRVGRLIEKHSA